MAEVFSFKLKRFPKPSDRTTCCSLCGNDRFVRISTRDRRREFLPTVACTQCGIISHETIPTDEEVAKYYADEYRQDYHGEVKPAPHRVMRAWKGGEWLANLLRSHLPTDGKICEIGAGIGCTVKVLENEGFQAEGIEPHRGFAEYSRKEIGASVVEKNLFDLPPEPTYDFILLVHVIEHFNSPRRALEHIRQLLKPGGQLYVECPNFAGPHAAPGKQFHYAHIYNFTGETLENLARVCGYETVRHINVESDTVLRFIFSRGEIPESVDTTGGFERLQSTLRKNNLLWYYLRPSYLGGRLKRDARFLYDRFLAGRRVQDLVDKSA